MPLLEVVDEPVGRVEILDSELPAVNVSGVPFIVGRDRHPLEVVICEKQLLVDELGLYSPKVFTPFIKVLMRGSSRVIQGRLRSMWDISSRVDKVRRWSRSSLQ
jgi:hypothetical protein